MCSQAINRFAAPKRLAAEEFSLPGAVPSCPPKIFHRFDVARQSGLIESRRVDIVKKAAIENLDERSLQP